MATGRGLVGFLALTLVIAAGCGAESALVNGSEPIHAPGIVSAPRRPIIVQPLPDGWSVSSAQPLDYLPGQSAMQALYLPPGSTPERGPALAVGEFGRDFGEVLCGFGRQSDVIASPGGFPGGRLVRSGTLSSIEGEVRTEQPTYVFGRELTETQLNTAASAAQFPESGVAEIATHGLPSGFRRVASAPVIPNAVFGEVIELRDASGNKSIRIGGYDGDAAADMLTRFWNATVVPEPCQSNYQHRKAHGAVDGADVYLTGNTSQALLEQVAANLTTTDQAGFEAFQAKTGDQPAAALLRGCQRGSPGASVIVDSTQGKVRWALAMYVEGRSRSTCSAVVIDGQAQDGGSSAGSSPAVAGAGSNGVDVLENATGAYSGAGSTHVIGGTAPATATRVVISEGTSAQVEAKLVNGGSDPTRKFFGGLLYPSASLFASVVAYDKDGNEVGRYTSPRG